MIQIRRVHERLPRRRRGTLLHTACEEEPCNAVVLQGIVQKTLSAKHASCFSRTSNPQETHVHICHWP